MIMHYVRIDDHDGTWFYICSTMAIAQEVAYRYVRSEWKPDYMGPIPEDKDDAIEAYFWEDRWLEIDAMQVTSVKTIDRHFPPGG